VCALTLCAAIKASTGAIEEIFMMGKEKKCSAKTAEENTKGF
jgi:hypothetical protein